MRRVRGAAALTTAVVLVASGCGGSIVAKRQPKSPSATASARGGGMPQATWTIPHESLTQKQTLRVAVTALYRSGPFVRLGVKTTCVRASGGVCDQPRIGFDAGGATFDGNYGGFELIDPVGRKQYLAVRDDSVDHSPLASSADDVKVGESENGWVVFPAPPKSVRTLDVAVPAGGPLLLDVPIGQPRPDTQKASPNPGFNGDPDTTSTEGLQLPVYDMTLHSTAEGEEKKQAKDRTDVTLSSDVLFEFDKADLTPKARSVLRRVAKQMNAEASGTIAVTGYTDAKGTPKVNKPLSRKRAKAVADYLKDHVQRELSYSISGKGEADPVAPNTKPDGSDNPKGRAKNRRVTLSYRVHREAQATSASPSTTRTSAAPGPVRWRASTSVGGLSTFEVTAHELRRHGDGMAVLHFGVKCVKGKSDGCELTRNIGHGFETIRRFSVYDPANKVRYQQVTNGNDVGDTVSTSVPDEIDVPQTVAPGAERQYWAYFPAPDPDVTSVTLTMPYNEATVEKVPVTG